MCWKCVWWWLESYSVFGLLRKKYSVTKKIHFQFEIDSLTFWIET